MTLISCRTSAIFERCSVRTVRIVKIQESVEYCWQVGYGEDDGIIPFSWLNLFLNLAKKKLNNHSGERSGAVVPSVYIFGSWGGARRKDLLHFPRFCQSNHIGLHSLSTFKVVYLSYFHNKGGCHQQLKDSVQLIFLVYKESWFSKHLPVGLIGTCFTESTQFFNFDSFLKQFYFHVILTAKYLKKHLLRTPVVNGFCIIVGAGFFHTAAALENTTGSIPFLHFPGSWLFPNACVPFYQY